MLGIAALVFAQAQGPDFVLPIDRGPIFAVRANIEGADQTFGIDTGSFKFLLKPNTADQLGKKADVQIPFLSPDPSEATLTNFPSHVRGVIGLDHFREKAIGIDSQTGQAAFWNQGQLSESQVVNWFGQKPEVVDLQDAGDGHYAIDATINGQMIKLGLDTDCSISTIDASVAPTQGFQILGNSNLGGLNRKWQMQIGVADSFSFGSQEMKSVPLAEAPAHSFGTLQGLLGYDLIQGRKAIIDFPGHKLYLGPMPTTPTGPEALDAYGIHLAPYLQGHQFIAIAPGSTAKKAGLKTGDEIVSIDDQPLSPENFSISGSTLPVDYSKFGLPKSLKVTTKASAGGTKTSALTI